MRKYIIVIFIIMLLTTIGINKVQSNLIETQNNNNEIQQTIKLKPQNKNVEKIVDKQKEITYNEVESEPNQEDNNYIIMQATGYDLSIQCCGKSYNHPSRGITRNGYNLNNKSHDEAWTVSSTKFPMGTKLQLEFPESHKKYNGIYTVRDSGDFGKNILDIYIGDFGEKVHQDTINFGRVNVKVLILKE